MTGEGGSGGGGGAKLDVEGMRGVSGLGSCVAGLDVDGVGGRDWEAAGAVDLGEGGGVSACWYARSGNW